MSRGIQVPITGEVLRWAVAQSGLEAGVLAEAAGVDAAEFARWMNGTSRPLLTQMRAVAHRLHRQLATFLLPAPPTAPAVDIRFRHSLEGKDRPLNSVERRFIRRAHRLQDAQQWLGRELGRDAPGMSGIDPSSTAASAADRVRAELGVTLDDQRAWKSASVAFDGWRRAVEARGVTVALFPLGSDSCRGFSLWSDAAPFVAVNTAWNDEARIFTLFHEYGHLATRTDSACAVEAPSTVGADPIERWCEAFAAAVLLPAGALADVNVVTDLTTLSRLARRYRVSIRATALRLIELNKAHWPLYRSIPASSDAKPKGGGGSGRDRREIREDELGSRGTRIFVDAVRNDVITSSQAVDYLDIPIPDLDHMVAGSLGL